VHTEKLIKAAVYRITRAVLEFIGPENGSANLQGEIRMPLQKIFQGEDKIEVGPDAQEGGAVQKPLPLGRGRAGGIKQLQGADCQQDCVPRLVPVQGLPLLGGITGAVFPAELFHPSEVGLPGLRLPLGKEPFIVPVRGFYRGLRLRGRGAGGLSRILQGFPRVHCSGGLPGGPAARKNRCVRLRGSPAPAAGVTAGLLIGGVEALEALRVVLGMGGFQPLGIGPPDFRQLRGSRQAQLAPRPAHGASSSFKGSGGRAASPR
jgi:hypothetical protein